MYSARYIKNGETIMSKLTSLIRRAPKRASAVIAMIAAAVIVPAALFAYGPVGRATFTFEAPAPYVTFNSITDNPSVGDERNFVLVRDDGTTADYSKTASLVPGHTYDVEVYYHNNAATNLDYAAGSTNYNTGVGVAQNAMLRMQLPGTINGSASDTVDGFISASNAVYKDANGTTILDANGNAEHTVWDSATLTNSSASAIAVRYIPGSATVTSNGAVNGSVLPASLFTTGANLGYDSLNGVLPGCNQFAGYVTFKFTVDQPNFTVVKQVSVDGGKTWASSAQTTPGSTIQYRVVYTNTGTTQQDNVTVNDTLPQGVSYVAGSSVSANALTGGQYKPTVDGVTTNGLNIGSFAPTANAYVKFSALVASNDQLPVCGLNTLTNTARVTTSGGYKESTAVVTVNKTCTTPGCVTTTTNSCTPTPPELPHTGPSETIAAFLGLGALVTSIVYYVTSRRKIAA
jgi:uncharacterized repeat protein (TIGR01451 family)